MGSGFTQIGFALLFGLPVWLIMIFIIRAAWHSLKRRTTNPRFPKPMNLDIKKPETKTPRDSVSMG